TVARPSQCSCSSTTVNCERRSLSSVPAEIVCTTQSLILRFNLITKLEPGGVFDRLVNLQKLLLHDNQLLALPAAVFDKLTKLIELRLPDNLLTALPNVIFDKLTQLVTLDLNGNQLSSVPADTFHQFVKLQKLWLKNNKLTALPAGLFDKLTQVNSLSLNDNQLKSMPWEKVSMFIALLPNNTSPLNYIHTSILKSCLDVLAPLIVHLFHSIEMALLKITDGLYKIMDDPSTAALVGLDRSAIFNTIDNEIVFGRLQSRFSVSDVLDLCCNKFTQLPTGIDKLTKLKLLALQGNQLKSVPGTKHDC
ncbi:uncharacterized protein LOC144727909, partial [Lampetra planeri]